MKSRIIVIGGGLIGCAVATELASRNFQVLLFEKHFPGQEASWASAGMLAPQTEAKNPDPLFQLCIKSSSMYKDYVQELKEITGLDPCYRTSGAIQIAFDQSSIEQLLQSHKWQFEQGLKIEWLTHQQALDLEPNLSNEVAGALFYQDEFQIDNRKLVETLITAAERKGVEIHSGCQVTEILTDNYSVTGIVANEKRYSACKVINAAGSWGSMLKVEDRFLPKVFPVRGQMVSLKTSPSLLKQTVHFDHYYLVPRFDGTIIVGSTTEQVGYEKRVTTAGLESLLANAQKVVPTLATASFKEAWAGLRPATEDGLPILGQHPEISGLIFATGHYRNGVLLVPITAKLIAELVEKEQEPDQLLPFSPARFLMQNCLPAV
ncbi:MAG: glycine oxidase ThiO [Blastocatellia bacterium]|nr:glycine oxidase ThiO [Blastocatellia bacterium]